MTKKLTAAPAGQIHADDAFDQLQKAGATNVSTRSEELDCHINGKPCVLKMTWAGDGHRYVKKADLDKLLSQLKSVKSTTVQAKQRLTASGDAKHRVAALNAALKKQQAEVEDIFNNSVALMIDDTDLLGKVHEQLTGVISTLAKFSRTL